MTILWIALITYGLLMWVIAPATSAVASFLAGRDRAGRTPGVELISTSIIVSWIFAKSVTNAANLGRDFGLIGGLGYAVYYLGIPICGLLILRIRRMTGAGSLVQYLTGAYGPVAAHAFLAIVLLRLFNEVWSNTAVVAAYFGAPSSGPFIASALVLTALVLLYTIKGGMRASLVTDAVQFVLLAIVVAATLAWIVPRAPSLPIGPARAGLWNSGIDFLLVALVQCVAYPFHDPVLTDRAFLSDARTTMKSYIFAGAVAGAMIVLFSLVGSAARTIADPVSGDAPVQVAAAGGTVVLTLMMIVMMLSAGSTIDSTFSSTSRAVAVDLGLRRNPVLWGRIAMILMAILGNLPMVWGTNLLKATTVSGLMVLGLAPVFLFPSARPRHPLVFLVPVGISVIAGVVSAFWPDAIPWSIGAGRYGSLLAWNLLTAGVSWGAFALLWCLPALQPDTMSADVRATVPQVRDIPWDSSADP